MKALAVHLKPELKFGTLRVVHSKRPHGGARRSCAVPDSGPLTSPAKSTQQNLPVRFGPFRLIPSQRVLLESGKPVKLGNRAFEILNILLEKPGQLVSKDELIARVWPTVVVEEDNLRVHVAALRRALGDGQRGNRYIATAAGRGYSFVDRVTRDTESWVPSDPQVSTAARHNLPSPLSRMVGRPAEVESLVGLGRSQRLLTLVGPAGVGKSTLALAVARQLLPQFDDGAFFVDLSAISSAGVVPGAFATALGLSVSASAPLSDLVTYLKSKSLLMILDNCEHLVGEVASATEALLRRCSDLHILVTSREALNMGGEWIYRVAPLPVPEGEEDPIRAEVAHRYAAVELFVERAVIGDHRFELTDTNAAVIAHICRSLDGLPLAIELAAARVNVYGIQELAAKLDYQVSRFASGRRTAPSRYQTLRATLDWSYEVLTEHERIALRRLAVFHGAFTLESAVGLVAREQIGIDEARVAVTGLADKSLLTTDVSGDTVRHRLLNTTRWYAFEKLGETQDIGRIIRWHAEQVLKLMRQAELAWGTTTRSEWVSNYAYAIDDVRASLDWAFSRDGDALLGTELTAVSVPFGVQLSLVDEFRARAQYALDWVAAHGTVQPPCVEPRLRAALSALSRDPVPPGQADDTLESQLAERMRTSKQRINPLSQKTIYQIEVANYAEALCTAETLGVLARQIADPMALLMADRVSAQAQHFCGNHVAARTYAERVLDHPAGNIPLEYGPLQVDRHVSMRIVLARILWLRGHAERSLALVQETLELVSAGSPLALCQVLALAACPIALWCGEHKQAQERVTALMHESARYRLDLWRSYGEWFQRALDSGVAETLDMKADLTPRESARYSAPSGLLLDTLLTISPAIAAVDLSLIEGGRRDWSTPEKLRVAGELILRGASPGGMPRAEMLFLRAIEVAEHQNALAWNLRASMSLSKLWSQQDQKSNAFELLNGVYRRFSEGFQTKDMCDAQALLDCLRRSGGA